MHSHHNTRLAAFLDRLKGVRRSGDGWTALCPAHDDRQRSLSIHEPDGKVLLHCHAGCPPEKVVATVGLKWADLFEQPRARATKEKTLVGTYDYFDENRKLLYRVERYSPKSFRQCRPDGKGGWTNSVKGVRRVLYRLPDLRAADPAELVYFLEGEKDVASAESHKLVATTIAGGAKAPFTEEMAGPLRGRDVVIVPDNDPPGREFAERVALVLRGIAQSVRIVELPGLLEKGDLSDWLNAGHTKEELLYLVEQKAREESDAERLLEDPALLRRFLDDIAELGVVGEEINCQTFELAMVSALGERPINLTVKGESGSGKNFQSDMVASLHPPVRVRRLTRISAKALYYLPDDLSHQVLILAEVAGGEEADYSIREIESSGELVMLVTEKKDGRFQATERRVKGPVAIINTTTKTHLNLENETRHFEISTDESEEQTARIFRAQARPYEDPAVELHGAAIRKRWQAAHSRLKPFLVLIPFASRIGAKLPRAPVRMRRDHPRVLSIITASALLHQRQREHQTVGGREYVVAAREDYEIARLVAEPMMRRAVSEMTDKCRALVNFMEKKDPLNKYFTVSGLAHDLRWSWRTAKKYIEEAEALGLVERNKSEYAFIGTDGRVPDEILPRTEDLFTTAEAAEVRQTEGQPSEKTALNIPPAGVHRESRAGEASMHFCTAYAHRAERGQVAETTTPYVQISGALLPMHGSEGDGEKPLAAQAPLSSTSGSQVPQPEGLLTKRGTQHGKGPLCPHCEGGMVCRCPKCVEQRRPNDSVARCMVCFGTGFLAPDEVVQ